MQGIELLSPAGDFKTALTAFWAGADAVYCGLVDFSARAFATNFTLDDLRHLVAYARAHGKKVYVTFNTVVEESEIDDAIRALSALEEIGPDALIVQDLGVAQLCRTHFPRLTLHASTQLVAHNLEGVLALKEIGFTRVVLARELSLEEVASISKRCGGLEQRRSSMVRFAIRFRAFALLRQWRRTAVAIGESAPIVAVWLIPRRMGG